MTHLNVQRNGTEYLTCAQCNIQIRTAAWLLLAFTIMPIHIFFLHQIPLRHWWSRSGLSGRKRSWTLLDLCEHRLYWYAVKTVLIVIWLHLPSPCVVHLNDTANGKLHNVFVWYCPSSVWLDSSGLYECTYSPGRLLLLSSNMDMNHSPFWLSHLSRGQQ